MISSDIRVQTKIPFSAELLDETSQKHVENADAVKEIFEANMQNLAFENDGLEFESLTVSFSNPSSLGFASTSVKTEFTTSGDAPADISESVTSAATSSITTGDGEVISVDAVSVVTTEIEVIEIEPSTPTKGLLILFWNRINYGVKRLPADLMK